MEHTKGPWKARSIAGHLFELLDAQGGTVLRIRSGMVPVPADACLIAAAPDLLAALECIARDYQNMRIAFYAGRVSDGDCPALQNARAVIAKAKGAA
jgi:hypothetical protein